MEINCDNLISRLNTHIKNYNLKKSDLLDNSAIYLDIDDFKELFKRIKFEITLNDLNSLFKYKNNSWDEGYIFGKTFFENLNLTDLPFTEKTFEENKFNSKNYLKNEKDNKINLIDFKDINDQLKLIQNEVKDIVKNNLNSNKKNVISGTKTNHVLDRKFSSRNKSVKDKISSNNASEKKTSNFISKIK